MQIDKIELIIVRLPLLRPFTTSTTRRSHIEHILIKAHGDGVIGWGECACSSEPYYSEETTQTCWHMLKDFLAPAVLARPWSTIEELTSFYSSVKWNNFAKAGMELACWDLLAKVEGRPLHALLGGTRREIHSGVSLGIEESTDKLLRLVASFLDVGYRRIKLKIAPGHDIEVLSKVRERHPDAPLMVDANSAYSLSDLPTLRVLDDFNLMMIEQPLAHDDLLDHATVQEALQTPICLDESIRTAEDARKAIELNSCQVINIKASRLGGLLEAKRTHDLCQARGIPVWCGGMHEFGIGRAANIALCSQSGFSIPGDISGSDKYFKEDLVTPPIRAIRGTVHVPDAAGLGYTPVEERIRKHAVQTLSVTS